MGGVQYPAPSNYNLGKDQLCGFAGYAAPQVVRTADLSSEENDADHMAYLRSVPGPGGQFTPRTPPLPRALSNTIMKISNRENCRSPPVGRPLTKDLILH